MEAPTYFNHSPWFPNPLICGRDMATAGYKEIMERLPWNGLGVWLQETATWVERSVFFDMYCILIPLLIATLLTILRMTLNWALFNVRILICVLYYIVMYVCALSVLNVYFGSVDPTVILAYVYSALFKVINLESFAQRI